ncbi:MAG: PIN domain-containing protein [Bacilli bacterium]
MAFVAFLDTCVLYPANLRDVLLSIAEVGIYQIRWSEDVLEELKRNLSQRPGAISFNSVSAGAAYVLQEMTRAFDDALVPRASYELLIASMPINEKDRHVLAAAQIARADVLVTDNIRDFPESTVRAFGIDVQNADTFLCYQFYLNPIAVMMALQRMAAARRSPLHTLPGMLSALTRSAPRFAAGAQRYLETE